MDKNIQDLIEKLSPIEIKIIPYLDLPVKEIIEKSGLDSTSVLRALQFLSNKDVLEFTKEEKNIIELGTNGIYYKKNHLPERKLLILLEEKNHLPLEEAKKLSKLSENEFKVSLGLLKRKNLIKMANGKISLAGNKEDLSYRSPEEHFLEILPIEESKLSEEQKEILKDLQKRKNIVKTKKKTIIGFNLTNLGKWR